MTDLISIGPNIQCNLKLNPSGTKYYFANTNAVVIGDIQKSKIETIIDFKQTVRYIENINETTIAIGTERGTVLLYNIQDDTKKVILNIGEYPIISLVYMNEYLLALSPMRLLLLKLDGTIIDDISSKILIETATLIDDKDGDIPSIAYALTDAQGTLVLRKNKNERRIAGNKTWITGISQSENKERLFIATDSGKVYIHKYPSFEVESVVVIGDLKLSGLTSHGNDMFIVSSIDCSIQFFKLSDLWLSSLRLGGVGEERYIRFAFNERSRVLLALTNMCHIHGWILDEKFAVPTQIVLPTGHSQQVSSVQLYALPNNEEDEKIMLITSSLDYTSRVYVKSVPIEEGQQHQWVELARPLVHGYPLSQAYMINHPMRLLISSEEEKPVRILETTKYFIESLRYITKTQFTEEELCYYDKSAIGANHQPLSLTNCPIREHTGSSRQSQVQSPTRMQIDIKTLVVPDSDEMPVDDVIIASVPKVYMIPPPEEELHYHTLWPETNKLLDQQSEVTHIAISPDEEFVVTGGLYLKPSRFTVKPIPAKTLYLWEKDGEKYKVAGSFLAFGEEDEIQSIVFEKNFFAVGGREGKLFVVEFNRNEDIKGSQESNGKRRFEFTEHRIDVCAEKISALCYINGKIVCGTPSGQLYTVDSTTFERDFGLFMNKNITAMKHVGERMIIGYADGFVDIIDINGEGVHFGKSKGGKIMNCCPAKIVSISALEKNGKLHVVVSDEIGTIVMLTL